VGHCMNCKNPYAETNINFFLNQSVMFSPCSFANVLPCSIANKAKIRFENKFTGKTWGF